MNGIMHLDLAKLIKAMDGRRINFFCKDDGEPLSDKEAREVLAAYLEDCNGLIPMRPDDTIHVRPDKPSRVDKLRGIIRKLEQDIIDYIRKHHVFQAPRLMYAKLQAAKDELKEAEAYEPKKLSKLISEEMMERHGLGRKMVKVHIAADYLSEVTYELRSALKACDIEHCTLYPIVGAIIKKTTEFTDLVSHPEFSGLAAFMREDKPLMRDLDTLCDRYLSTHLNITDYEL